MVLLQLLLGFGFVLIPTLLVTKPKVEIKKYFIDNLCDTKYKPIEHVEEIDYKLPEIPKTVTSKPDKPLVFEWSGKYEGKNKALKAKLYNLN